MQASRALRLVTGFLGAGKTTLVQHILHNAEGRRVAVVVNELGPSLGLEKALLQAAAPPGSDAADFVELPNGCICCSVKGSFLQTLEALLARREETPFTHIVVETTGLADPGPVAQALWADEAVEPGAALDGVVTVVDAASFVAQLGEPNGAEAAAQVAYADVVLLNKSDTAAGAAGADGAASAVRGINPMARIVVTSRSVVSLDQILDIATLGGGNASRAAAEGRALVHALPHGGGPLRLPGAAGGVGTVVLRAERPVEEAALVGWLERLLWESPGGCPLLRAKGVVAVRAPICTDFHAPGGEAAATAACNDSHLPGDGTAATVVARVRVRVLQAVRDVYELTDGGDGWEPSETAGAGEQRSEAPSSVIVLIGRGLDGASLRASFSQHVGT